MTSRTEREHIQAAFEVARRHLYDLWKAERMCELRDRIYKKYDGRGFHSASLEVGRMYACAELLGDVEPTELDFAQLRRDAREDAQAVWREETFKDFLPQPDEEAA